MGAQLVGQVFAFAATHRLSGNEFRVLAYMAHTALDTDAEPLYWASRERTALALGHLVPDPPMPGDPNELQIQRVRERAFYAVKVSVAELIRKGAIERMSHGRVGHTATFRLTLTRGLLVENPPAQPGRFSPRRGGNSIPSRVENPPPDEP